MNRAVTHVMNAYNIPNLNIDGYICKTNLPSNTAFRGFGAPQAMLVAETMMRHIASYLKKDLFEVSFHFCNVTVLTKLALQPRMNLDFCRSRKKLF